jgi:hypothetical protein
MLGLCRSLIKYLCQTEHVKKTNGVHKSRHLTYVSNNSKNSEKYTYVQYCLPLKKLNEYGKSKYYTDKTRGL